LGLLAEAVRRSSGVAGPHQLRAHLSACHCTAPSRAETDWDRIVGLYALLLTVSANPAVALNRAVAVGQRDGPAAMLDALDAITAMPRSHLWHAGRADALHRLGLDDQASRGMPRGAPAAVWADRPPTPVVFRLYADPPRVLKAIRAARTAHRTVPASWPQHGPTGDAPR
jgi:predicted RNA polymerase sigma factor